MNSNYSARAYFYSIIFLLIPVTLYSGSLESLCTFLCDCSPVNVCENEKEPMINTFVLHKKFSQQLSLQYIIHEKPEDPTKFLIYFLIFTNGCHEIKLTEKKKDISEETWTPYLSKCTNDNDSILTKTESPFSVKKIDEDDLPKEIRAQFTARALRFGNLYKTEWTKPIDKNYYLSIKNIHQKGILEKFN